MGQSRSAKKTKKVAKKIVRKLSDGIVKIQCTFNNVIISIHDLQGQTLAWESAGSSGFKGRRKATPFAAQEAAKRVIAKVVATGLNRVRVFVKGPGSGSESAVRTFQSSGIKVDEISNVTPIPHNGCRPAKKRRV